MTRGPILQPKTHNCGIRSPAMAEKCTNQATKVNKTEQTKGINERFRLASQKKHSASSKE